ncbi:hypothetical protein [uncultured Rikenella sp.]|uniref:hypothetical protein n=1 Tax=uncultured Rikenella sp. TaxID=368003 RepID=UPI00263018EB|nr:hypothetical protein [uncultured Rikenella sp.]
MVVDHSGYSWSSTVGGTNGVHLGFNVTWLDPNNADNRAHGFQLHCLSEETDSSRPGLPQQSHERVRFRWM